MPDVIPPKPIRYTPSLEHSAENEAEVIAELSRVLSGITEKTFADHGHATRSVHAKGHALLHAELRVHDGLPATLAQGMFARPNTYRTVMRFSTIPGDVLPDEISTPRGVALKVIGVEGARLPDSEDATTQDFVLVNAPAFSAPTAEKFLGSLKLLARTTDRAEGAKKVLSRFARGTESLLEAFGVKSALVSTLGGHPATNILGETYYSQVPILYGDHIAKISLAPVSGGLVALTHAPVDVNDHPDALRAAVQAHFSVAGGEWELRVQLCTDAEAMPIEDATVAWPEDQSPYVAVATLSARPQDSWSEADVAAIEEGAAFSPWHGLAAHRPLGSVMRARKATYQNSANQRGALNHCPIHEPR